MGNAAVDQTYREVMTIVYAALNSGDIELGEMPEFVLHFAVYYGFAKGEALSATAEAAWATRPGQ